MNTPQNLPAGLPPLPANSRYAGRLNDHSESAESVIGHIWFDGRECWSSIESWGTDVGTSDIHNWHFAEAIPAESPAPAVEVGTPETDAAVDRCWLDGFWSGDFEEFARSLERRALAAESERDQLAAWKGSAMIVLAEIDTPAIAAMLKVPLGASVSKAIAPGIRDLQAKLATARDALEAILPFIPITSASEGGAAKFSANVRAADLVRSALTNIAL